MYCTNLIYCFPFSPPILLHPGFYSISKITNFKFILKRKPAVQSSPTVVVAVVFDLDTFKRKSRAVRIGSDLWKRDGHTDTQMDRHHSPNKQIAMDFSEPSVSWPTTSTSSPPSCHHSPHQPSTHYSTDSSHSPLISPYSRISNGRGNGVRLVFWAHSSAETSSLSLDSCRCTSSKWFDARCTPPDGLGRRRRAPRFRPGNYSFFLQKKFKNDKKCWGIWSMTYIIEKLKIWGFWISKQFLEWGAVLWEIQLWKVKMQKIEVKKFQQQNHFETRKRLIFYDYEQKHSNRSKNWVVSEPRRFKTNAVMEQMYVPSWKRTVSLDFETFFPKKLSFRNQDVSKP